MIPMKNNSDIRNILIISFLFMISIIPLGILTDASQETFACAPLPDRDYASPKLELGYETLENMADYMLVESDISEYPLSVSIPEGSTADSILSSFLEAYGLNEENFSFFYYNTFTQETYLYNPDTLFTAASTVKVPVNMLYYDAVNSGERTLEDGLPYNASATDTDGDGSTPYDYRPGSLVPLSYLMEESIVFSDNTANNIMIQNLGGVFAYRNMMLKYSDNTYPDEFFTGNKLCAGFSFDVMSYLYSHSSAYEPLLEYMKEAAPGTFLQKNIDLDLFPVAHKYGDYGGCRHDYGIIYTPAPFLIGVFADHVADAENLIAEIGETYLCYTLSVTEPSYIKISEVLSS